MKNSAKRLSKARRSPRPRLLISCEHGGNRVPRGLKSRFAASAELLDSHRGLDYGALQVARALGRRLGVQPFVSTTTRLVVDLNRSPNHRNVFSDLTRALTRSEREAIMAEHYWPYRTAVEGAIATGIQRGGCVWHISSHSFTPVLRGQVRNCDIGFLYDPARGGEVALISAWSDALRAAAPTLRVRRNYPYRGTSDALVTHLRRRFAATDYVGIELEVNQKHFRSSNWSRLVAMLAVTLERALDDVACQSLGARSR